jgi:ATP/maltotriose-dependent transcriptional regulator MalT
MARPRLIERLNEGYPHTAGSKLTLISCPCRVWYKTTLVSEWAATLTPAPLPNG